MPHIVVDVVERAVDFLNALPDDIAIREELRLEYRHILNRILTKSLLEFRQQFRQIIFANAAVELLVLAPVCAVQLVRKIRVTFIME